MPEHLRHLLDDTWHGITGLRWLVAAAIVVIGTGLVTLIRSGLLGHLRAVAARSKTDLDDFFVSLAERTGVWFVALLMLRSATLVLELSDRWDERAQMLLIVGGMIQGGLWGSALVLYLVDRRFARHVGSGRVEPHVMPVGQTLLRSAGLVLVWTIVLMTVLSSFGIDISGLVTGLGIGGVAVALAVQKILGDVLASILIAVDRPFSPGDYIALGTQQGTVLRIGIRSTVIASLGGEELIIANNDLLSARVQNYTRMTERRVSFKVGLVYDTTPEQLDALPALIKELLADRGQVRFERGAVTNLADSWIEVEVAYWVLDPSYDLFVAIHQA
ncbi:MAG TPA: mechanosensitive ion channel domain-containing protein, partial [Nannocystis sp.]